MYRFMYIYVYICVGLLLYIIRSSCSDLMLSCVCVCVRVGLFVCLFVRACLSVPRFGRAQIWFFSRTSCRFHLTNVIRFVARD